MERILLFLFVLMFTMGKSQIFFSGKVASDEVQKLDKVQIHNMRTGLSVVTSHTGDFRIEANPGDEIRFVSAYFMRSNLILTEEHFKNEQVIRLVPFEKEIAEVKLDKKAMKDKVAYMQSNIGLPPSPKKPREVPPPSVKQVGVLKYIMSNRNLNNLYKNLSGDTRRMRSLYQYEDFEEKLKWIKESLGDNYFQENEIPEDRQKEFIHFVMGKEDLQIPIKEKNITAVKFALSQYVIDFVKLIQ